MQSGVVSFITKWDNFIIKWDNHYRVVLNCLFSKKAKSEKKHFFSLNEEKTNLTLWLKKEMNFFKEVAKDGIM